MQFYKCNNFNKTFRKRDLFEKITIMETFTEDEYHVDLLFLIFGRIKLIDCYEQNTFQIDNCKTYSIYKTYVQTKHKINVSYYYTDIIHRYIV